MAFTGRLGTSDSRLGQIQLGEGGEGGFGFTANAIIRREGTSSFSANAVIRHEQTTGFTADAVILSALTANAVFKAIAAASFAANAILRAGRTASFTADAIIPSILRADAIVRREQTQLFTANAVVRRTQSAALAGDALLGKALLANAVLLNPRSASFTAFAWVFGAGVVGFSADAVIRTSQSLSLSADAVIRRTQTPSFTANATKKGSISRSFTTDAYIPLFRQRHARTGPHIGTDTDLDHLIAWAFGRYLRGENLQQVLADIDSRLTAREGGRLAQRRLLPTEAIFKKTQSKSLLADAYYVIRVLTSFTANAFFQYYFKANSWIIDPAITIRDDVLTAQTWPINTTPRAAFITTASLTGDATNDPGWWASAGSYVTGWAKFTLSGTKTVILDTVMTGGDSVLELWTGGPGSWPSQPAASSDDDVANEQSPYGSAERIEISLSAGTYWALVHMFDEGDPDFNILLRMQTTT